MSVVAQYRLTDENARIPTKAHETDAGWDIYSVETITIPPSEWVNVKTGIQISVPRGWYYTIEGRSSLGFKGIMPFRGIIDATYCGNLQVLLYNISDEAYTVNMGDRVAQIVPHLAADFIFSEVKEFDDPYKKRGERGFGSSGK